jgi:hypothetical protein
MKLKFAYIGSFWYIRVAQKNFQKIELRGEGIVWIELKFE